MKLCDRFFSSLHSGCIEKKNIYIWYKTNSKLDNMKMTHAKSRNSRRQRKLISIQWNYMPRLCLIFDQISGRHSTPNTKHGRKGYDFNNGECYISIYTCLSQLKKSQYKYHQLLFICFWAIDLVNQLWHWKANWKSNT